MGTAAGAGLRGGLAHCAACGRGYHLRLLPNLWQDNFLTASIPSVYAPDITRSAGNSAAISQHVCARWPSDSLRRQGQSDLCHGTNPGRTRRTRRWIWCDFKMIWLRLRPEISCSCCRLPASPKILAMDTSAVGRQALITIFAIFSSTCRTWQRRGFIWPRVYSPNSYGGATRPLRRLRNSIRRGRLSEDLDRKPLLRTARTLPIIRCRPALRKTRRGLGLGLQASYTYGKSLDDTSAVLGGLFGTAGTSCKRCRKIRGIHRRRKVRRPSM